MNWFAIVSFAVIILAIYMYAYYRSRSVDTQESEGYFLGGRSLVGTTIGMTILMTNLSTEHLVGQNGQSYVAGVEVMAWEVTAAVAIVMCAWVFLPRYFKYGVNTISDFIEVRYDTMTKRIVSILFMFTYIVSFMPVVLYSGALIFNDLFNIEEHLGVSAVTAVVIIAAFIGLVGILYLFVGGLSLAAHSDSIYGVGLIVGGLTVTVLGFIALGNDSFLAGVDHLVTESSDKLNAWGPIDSSIVPWPTLFFGMFFNNLYFWCTNQMIVQKALAAKNLKEAQKGTMMVGFFKIFGLFFLVIPGIIAYNMFGGDMKMDLAYPTLVNTILPDWSYGIFGAVVFGAIMSSFVGALNATVTLFSLDFYKPVINKQATNRQIAKMGRILTVVVGLIVVIIAPLISLFPQGLFAVIQEFNGLYNMPLLAIILVGFFSKKTSALGAKWTFIFHVVTYSLSKFLLADIHYLYVWSVLFLLDLAILYGFSSLKPDKEDFEFEKYKNKVDLKPWKHSKLVGTIILSIVVAMYIIFSPLVLAS
ncbi:solute:sodium symporter family transporter [Fictibacillus phosphorivorans]|uniref:solute:sodium symporter family transporter n=1 Tax=Fictibacillus phosphorivorans TaxID=1221500 RepID=UPI002041F35D|nr:solute:sodium symporter family transporter [Fictibacillus phosphorivorans]MCM3717706.1 solute:sodium symporter family transporter [Fictibacillus phosphorivorans]MCM3775606.1 solute:sodium symporter family transporter [Fictibacillus phosphorivorans]